MAVAKRNPQLKKGDWNHPFDHRRGCSWIFKWFSPVPAITESYFHHIFIKSSSWHQNQRNRSAMVGQPVGQPWSAQPFRQGRALLPTAGDLAESMVLSERMDSKRTNFLGQFFRQSHTYRFNIYIYMVSSGRRLGFQPFFSPALFSAMSPCSAKNHSSQPIHHGHPTTDIDSSIQELSPRSIQATAIGSASLDSLIRTPSRQQIQHTAFRNP